MMGSVGKSTTETYSTTVAKTQGFYDPSLGQVIYVGYSQDCYRYNLSDPADPSKDIPVTLCSPASQPAQHHITIKDCTTHLTRCAKPMVVRGLNCPPCIPKTASRATTSVSTLPQCAPSR
jgi:hypothetical protein